MNQGVKVVDMIEQILTIARTHLEGAVLDAYAELLGGLEPEQVELHLEWMNLLNDPTV